MDSSDGYRYLVVSPEKGGLWDLWRFTVWGDLERGVRFLEGSEEVDEEVLYGLASDNRWVIAVSIVVRKIIAFSAKPMEYSGYVVDFILNLLSLNGNLLGLLYNIVHGKVAIPKRGTETFISTIGQIDGRIDLYRAKYLVEEVGDSAYEEREMKVEPGSRALMDLCIMASKLAYENAEGQLLSWLLIDVSIARVKEVDEEPDPNFFGLRYMIPVHLNAAWELIRSLTMGYTHGPEYKEGWFSILVRFVGLVVPGIAAHCPTDYVNTMRLGKKRVVQMSSF
ncbi:putative Triacylglycerol lipase [Tripterygium wilfordii]|uniref:Putative Triacylglycerol lipase n=1 Tax=Tripterygium wilfordii TaxID=458696 RepID=A0A7J7CHC5_TRIWF|nr:putative Triacylglycerol lipase [Tripterygium wilfordii]